MDMQQTRSAVLLGMQQANEEFQAKMLKQIAEAFSKLTPSP